MVKKIRCLACEYCDVEQKKCFAKSKDCKNEYDLTDRDIYCTRNNDCGFFKYSKTNRNLN